MVPVTSIPLHLGNFMQNAIPRAFPGKNASNTAPIGDPGILDLAKCVPEFAILHACF